MTRREADKNITEGIKRKEDILELKFKDESYVLFSQKSLREQLEYFAQIGIIHNTCTCICSNRMGLIKKKQVVDGYVWFCNNCRKEKTCRWGSVFEGFKSPIIKLFRAM
ncbi:hypothetical protein DMUE_1499 [Dictyocoela muelleri]|nr:hypothetical protein DMUE_1499 [Dictyocoela muelleri]